MERRSVEHSHSWKTIQQQIMYEGPAEGEHTAANTNRNYSLGYTCSIHCVCVSKQASSNRLICSVFHKSGRAPHLRCLREPTEPTSVFSFPSLYHHSNPHNTHTHTHSILTINRNNIPIMKTIIFFIIQHVLTVSKLKRISQSAVFYVWP